MIKTIARWQAYGEPWTSQQGEQLFPIAIQFDDGTSLLVNSKSPSKPPYDVGDQVEAIITGQTKTGRDKGKVKKIDPMGNFQRNDAPKRPAQAKVDMSVAEILEKVQVKTKAYLVARDIVARTADVIIDGPTGQELCHFAATCAYGMIQDGWTPDSKIVKEEEDSIPF